MNPPADKKRFVFIDGLRGLAAVGVMFFHLYTYSPFAAQLHAILPRPLTWLMEHGNRGVEIFFVLSGFVIAYSLRSLKLNIANGFNFIVRRQIRLDPAYWVCLAGATLSLFLQRHSAGAAAVPRPRTLIYNALYLHRIRHAATVLDVSWTLCLEVQLYLTYILLLLLIQQLLSLSPRRRPLIYLAAMTPLFLLSLTLHNRAWAAPWFLNGWHLFALGALVCWTMERQIPAAALGGAFAIAAAAAIYQMDLRLTVGIATAASIYFAATTGQLTHWLGNAGVQYLGAISYSLYLVHVNINQSVCEMGERINPHWALLWFALAAILSLAVAHVLHILVERPSMNFASRLKPRRSEQSPVIALAPQAA